MEKEEEEKDYCDYTFEEVINGEGYTIKDMKQFEAFEIAEILKNSNIAEITHWIRVLLPI